MFVTKNVFKKRAENLLQTVEDGKEVERGVWIVLRPISVIGFLIGLQYSASDGSQRQSVYEGCRRTILFFQTSCPDASLEFTPLCSSLAFVPNFIIC